MKEFIPREHYMSRIQPFIGKDIIKVFTGQRRVGKSYMMYQVMDWIEKSGTSPEIVYINKELADFDHIRNYKDLIEYVDPKRTGGSVNLFIDEIQEIDQFEKALTHFQASGNIDIYCTGSNANMLSGDLATLLSGRYVEIKIYALSYVEFLVFHNFEESQESFGKYLKFGGMPNLIHFPMEEEVVFDYLQGIYSSVIHKDIIRRHNIRNVSFLENLVKYCADNLGSIVSSKKISDYLRSQRINMSPNIVLDYLHFLCDSFFLHKVRRTEIGGKKIFEIGEKYYFEDTGLRNTILGYKPTDINKLLENLVYSHIKIAGYNVMVGVSGSREIDFVAEKSGEKIYVQVAYLLTDQSTINREFGNLLAIEDQYPKMVVSMDEDYSTGTFKGISHYNIREFLQKSI